MSAANAVTTTYQGLGEGQVVFGITGPYEQAFVQQTSAGSTYCISIDTEIYPGELLNEGTFADGVAAAPGGHLTIGALQTIYRIVNNAYPNDNPSFPIAGDINQKAASVQSAIWSFSNDWDLDPANPENDPVVIANYNLLRGWVDGDEANGEFPAFVEEPAASLSVDPTSTTAEINEKAGPFTIRIQDGESKVKVVVTDGTAVDSNGNELDPNYEYGDGEGFYITRSTTGTATAQISGEVTTAPGTVYIPVIVGHQLLLGAEDFRGTSTVNVEATFQDSTVAPSEPDVGGITVERPAAGSGVTVAGTTVSGTLAETGLNGMSLAAVCLGMAMLVLGMTLNAMKKLSEIHAV